MATMNISMPDPMKEWVDERVHTRQYASHSDYVRDLIRRDRERQDAIALIQAEIGRGIQSGPAEALDVDGFLADTRQGRAG